ncbi:5-formyltetrahydrofolate cyclo-ligase [Longimycelium tulufanense]|uniref:5-formyltetrahydrofolate cyclo-ligase n=1 Tax=Longimycelium tulufanense TaxID=907463 RepID=A0A8J3FXJ2_9PSEU|nr:5-formyltetrahydrofolate cyclo-ligase [Longimycelium tulufanense]GGM74652.1 5-formyltetrahydrofolate cyclo-ligase [Longimycelium tulufanense]
MWQDIDQAKWSTRERIWSVLDLRGVAHPPGASGRIPHFVGAELAARQLARLPEWSTARTVKSVPDKAQRPVRALALEQGKLVYMAVPMLAEDKPFYRLDPATLEVPPKQAADRRVARQMGEPVDVSDMQPVDLVVCGSVAVNLEGVRIGKGAGYSDIEIALLHEAGLVTDRTVIATTVHDLQVLEEPLPEAEHDFRVDIVVTPHEIIRCLSGRKRAGLVWNSLSAEKIATIPVLSALNAQRRS